MYECDEGSGRGWKKVEDRSNEACTHNRVKIMDVVKGAVNYNVFSLAVVLRVRLRPTAVQDSEGASIGSSG